MTAAGDGDIVVDAAGPHTSVDLFGEGKRIIDLDAASTGSFSG